MSKIRSITYCSPKHKFIYLAVPKVASSSIVAWMLQEEGLEWDSRNPKTIIPRIAQRNILLAKNPDFRGSFRFTVIRDPKSRLVSAYLDKFARLADTEDKQAHNPAKAVTKNHGTNGAITFRQFIHYLAQAKLPRVDIHWIPQSLLVKAFKPDMLGNFDELQPFLKKVEDRIGVPIQIGWERRSLALCDEDCGPVMDIPSVELGGRKPVMESFFDDEITKIVENLYADDFRLCQEAKSK